MPLRFAISSTDRADLKGIVKLQSDSFIEFSAPDKRCFLPLVVNHRIHISQLVSLKIDLPVIEAERG